jgi:hypothetical protein
MLRSALALLASLALSAATFLSARPAAASCAEAILRDGVVYYLDWDTSLRRYDLAAEAWLPVLRLAFDTYGFEIDGDLVWAMHGTAIVAYALNGDGIQYAVPTGGWIGAFGVGGGHVFTIVQGDVGHALRSYDAATGELESTLELGGYYWGGVIAAPGGRVLVMNYSQVDVVSYDTAGNLTGPVPLFANNLFEGSFRRVGDRLVAAQGVVDLATLAVVEGFEGYSPAYVGEDLVTLHPELLSTELRRFDAQRRLVGTRTVAGSSPIAALFGSDDALFALRCVGYDGIVERIPLETFNAPRPLPAPIASAGFEDGGLVSGATSEEGVFYFVTAEGGTHLRRWRVDEARFLASIPLREEPRHVTRAEGGGVWLTYASGRTTRIPRDGGAEIPFAFFPKTYYREPAEPIEAGAWVVLNDTDRFHVFSAEGEWQSAWFTDRNGYTSVAWDPAGERIVTSRCYPCEIETIELGADGVLGEGDGAALETSFPFAASTESRLFAGDRIVDLETLELVAALPFVYYDGRKALWHAPDRLVTVESSWYVVSSYREWSADGTPHGPAVTIPGRAVGLYPLGDRVLLVREVAIDPYGYELQTVFTVLTPGGDLDLDGTGDADDAFPIDPTEIVDSDGDGVGDNGDTFPHDSSESADTDGDGLGDNTDWVPDFPAARIAVVDGADWLGIAGLGRSDRPIRGQVHLLDDGAFAFCNGPESCLFGAWTEGRRGKGYAMTVFPEVVAAFGRAVQDDLTSSFDRKVRFRFLPKQARASAKPGPGGTVKFSLRLPHRMTVAGYGAFVGAYRVKADGTWLELEAAATARRPLPSAASRPRDASASPGPSRYRRLP